MRSMILKYVPHGAGGVEGGDGGGATKSWEASTPARHHVAATSAAVRRGGRGVLLEAAGKSTNQVGLRM